MKKVVAVTMIVTAVLVAGCSEEKATPEGQGNAERQGNAPKKAREDSQKAKTVIVNKGMSKKEEEKLNERLAELEDKVDNKPEQETANQEANQPEQETESVEETVRTAAQAHYADEATRNYSYT